MENESKLAIYARVSTDDQAEKQTIQTQITACREWAERKGYEIVEEFYDDGVSGAVPFSERPAGSRLLQALEGGRVARVVIYCIDRLSRDMESGVPAFNALRRTSQGVDFVLQSFDDTPEGRFQFNIFMAVADYERGVIARRTATGRQRRVRNGKYQVGVAGYGHTYSKETGQLEINEPEQAVCGRMLRMLTEDGMGTLSIADKLNADNVPAPGATRGRPGANGWTEGTVYNIVNSPRLIGESTYGPDKIPMPCPPLVDRALWDAGQLTLRRRARSKKATHAYLLKGFLLCRRCEGVYGAETTNGHPYYRCVRRRKLRASRGGHADIRWGYPAKDLDRQVQRWLILYLSDPANALSEARVTREESTSERAELTKALDGTLERERRIVDAYGRGLISEAAMIQQNDQIRAERAEIDGKLAALSPTGNLTDAELAALEFDVPQMFEDMLTDALRGERRPGKIGHYGVLLNRSDANVDDVLDTYAERRFDDWQRLVRLYVDRIYVEDDGSVGVEGRITQGQTPVASPRRS